ncbi:MAG: energy transducer TonB [Terriglobales bacterium]
MRWCRLLLVVALAGMAVAQVPTSSLYGWLRSYAGRRARDAAQDPLFSRMLQLSVPNWGLAMGRDRTLAASVQTQMRNSSRRVVVRDNRYLDLAGYRRDGGVSQSFFWVDLAQDQAIGAVYVCLGPAGGCDQQLLIFSRQIDPVASVAQLPPDFVSALAAWQVQARSGPPGCRMPNCQIPAVLTQYFIAGRRRHLLLHVAGRCAGPNTGPWVRCRSAEREASELDLAAAWREVSSVRAGAPLLAAEQDEGAWLAQRDQECRASGASPVCYSRNNERRAAALLVQLPEAASPPAAPRPSFAPQFSARAPACRNRAPIYKPNPKYSDAARQEHFQGSVLARLSIAPDGHVASVVIPNPIGYGLDATAEQALAQWQFQPLPAACPQVDTPAVVTLRFRLGPRLP